jgi:hypothetical protein
MSGSTPQAENPSGPSLSPGPDTHPGAGDGDQAGSGVQPDMGEGPATEPGQVKARDSGTEQGPDTTPSQQAIAGPDTAPGFGPAPGSGSQPGYPPEPGHGPQPGYPPPSGYATQPGYAPQPGYGYGPPAPGSTYPVPPARRPWRIWLGIIAGFMILAAVIAGISAYLLSKSQQKWALTAPQTLLGLSPDTSPADQLGFNALIAKFKSELTSLPHYGSLKSTVSGIYQLSPRHAVGFIGFNGTFNVRVVLKTGAGLTVTKANPGPHGGTAECGADSVDNLCQWSTGTTVGIMVVIPTNPVARPEKRRVAQSLMLEIRDSVEHPVH